MIAKFGRNPLGRDLIVGDIHGCFSKLQTRLDALCFDFSRDRLFSVGDLVDRGSESKQALGWLEKPWFHAVRGNHERMACMWFDGSYSDRSNYITNGGAWFLALTRPEQGSFANAFGALPLAIELQTDSGKVAIIHAECPFHTFAELEGYLQGPHCEQVAEHCVWSRDRITNWREEPVTDVRAVVVGHTPMDEQVTLGNHIYIDTMGWRRGEFTILDAATLQPAEAA